MNFKSVWLIVLTMLMGTASAANINFNGGSVTNCPLSGSTYNCNSNFAPGSSDIIVIPSGYTVVLSTAFTPGWDQGLSMSGSAALQTTGSNAINLTGSNNLNVSGGTLTAGGSFTLGSNPQTITANVVAASISTGGSSATINGNVTVTGNADLGSHTTISGAVKVGTISTNSDVSMGTLTATGSINLGSKTSVSGAVSGASISTNSQVTLGSLSVTGTADLGSQTAVNGNISANVLTTNSNVTLNGNVTATTSFTLGSGSDLTGNVTAPTVTLNPSNVTVKGNIAASTKLDMGSGTTVTGTVTGGSLLMRPANATINGSVTLTGDVDMGSQSNINGDLVARDVLTRSSFAIIDGNAAVNSIYIDWHDSVTKTITCTGPGAVGCSCVTKADPNYMPTCGAAPPSAPHHFQITHSGTALTCQPQTVTLTACANAACTAPHYASSVTATLSPGNQPSTVSGGSNSAATVQSGTAGVFALSASSAGVSNPTTCINTGTVIGGNACNMEFKTSGLTVSVPNHVSMSSGASVTIQALKASAPNQSCVPLVASQKIATSLTCSYTDPVPAKAVKTPVVVGGNGMVCNQDTTSVNLDFDANGKATATLSYAEIGLVGLNASIATGGFVASGSGNFYTAPAALKLTATSPLGATAIGPAALDSKAVQLDKAFAKASQSINVAVTAYNATGGQTRNFGQETSPSAINLTLDAINPEGGGNNGSATLGTTPSYASGAINTSFSFSDVGLVHFTFKLVGDYYMGQPEKNFNPVGEQYIGRIIPDHFETVLLSTAKTTPVNLATMDCPASTSSLKPCVGNSNGSFTHSNQNFYVKVLAYNGASPQVLTANYAGTLSRLITLQAATPNGGALDTNGTITWNNDPAPPATPTRFTFSGGIGTLDMTGISTANLPAYVFSSPHVPLTIYLRAIDADNASSQRTAPTPSVEAPLSVVSGRLQVSNTNGSPTAPLKVQVNAQYLTSIGYVPNPLAKASGIDKISKYIDYLNCQKALSGYCSTLKLSDSNAVLDIVNGVGKFTLAAPTPVITGIGSVDVILQKDGKDLIPFLPSTTGKETFGIYPSGPVIYTREIY